jgi:beta-ureidopropionase / N-carbamoyl-L-amino-acid hydrolase
VIDAAALGRRLAGVEPIGLGPDGTTRLAWTPQDAAARDWFATQADEAGLRVERDPAGSVWAVPDAPPPWWALGSHLDSVRGGGRFDGALGVAAAFEVAARATRPVAVLSFADEEGGRFNTPTFGSRALVGRLNLADVLARHDDDGTTLAEAMAADGVDPSGLSAAPEWLERLRGFLELHIDQSRDLAAACVPAGIVRALASRMRLHARLRGEADHAGTTRRAERRDALAAAARLIVATSELAEHEQDFVTTATRILVAPNALTTVPADVRLWIDARASEPAAVTRWRDELDGVAAVLAGRSGVEIDLETQSHSAGVTFDEGVRGALGAAADGDAVPELVCFAGHDAGVLAERLPAGMVLVRNRRGISHAPDQHVELDDAAVAASILLRAVERLS